MPGEVYAGLSLPVRVYKRQAKCLKCSIFPIGTRWVNNIDNQHAKVTAIKQI